MRNKIQGKLTLSICKLCWFSHMILGYRFCIHCLAPADFIKWAENYKM